MDSTPMAPLGLDPSELTIRKHPSWMIKAQAERIRPTPVPDPDESAGVGAPPEPDLMTMLRDTYGTVKSVQPLLEFLGNNPILATTLLLVAIGAGAAVGGYVGAGYKISEAKKNELEDDKDEERERRRKRRRREREEEDEDDDKDDQE